MGQLFLLNDCVLCIARNQFDNKDCRFDKEILGATAAKIRSYRKPEPFKGKGIKYENEFIFRKEGKKK